ncbi:peroxisomal membrane protein 11A [Syngnathus scovelli]|uniref:peroxisomal membrane protein 11A n=1 Tax=Syngnathus scovelli TaxID=161590 RepID=UPI00210F3AE6|nr:peroxisomal membrane protein 11A [Syngnathus scovelli]
MELVQNVINQSQGRDRLFRATQYACGLCAYALRNDNRRKDLVSKLERLEANMSAGRKLFRLGNTINAIESAKRNARLSDPALCLCLAAADMGRALYFICDNTLWATSVGLLAGIDKERWSAAASRCYLLSLVMSLSRDVYVISRFVAEKTREKHFRRKMISHLKQNSDVAEVTVPQLDALVFLLLHCFKSQPAVLLDTVKNVCDLSIPLDKLGIYRSNTGAVAFCGLLSSLIGIVTLVRPDLKIKA